MPDAPIISISTNFLLWNDVQSNDDNGITRFRLLINMYVAVVTGEGTARKKACIIDHTVSIFLQWAILKNSLLCQ